jgi:protein-S-isoprenylcysteine O-methyltransferase Ste14
MISLLLRNLLFTLLQPGIVVGVLPITIRTLSGGYLMPEVWQWNHFAGASLIVIGITIAAVCIIRFAYEGRGTLSPLDPTKRLVVRGLYKYSRNPMYVGMMLILAGESIFWMSIAVAVFAAVVFIGFNLFIIYHEEPRLRREFGDEYPAYTARVRRWL